MYMASIAPILFSLLHIGGSGRSTSHLLQIQGCAETWDKAQDGAAKGWHWP